MRRKLISKTAFLLMVVFLFLNAGDNHIHHTLKKGECISLICLNHYGYYTTKLGQAIKADNPKIVDLNIIYPGQVIQFRKAIRQDVESGIFVKPPVYKDVDSIPPFVQVVNVTQGIVTCVEGDAYICKAGENRKPLLLNMFTNPGDTIITGKTGRVEFVINRETVVRIKENTKATVQCFRNNAQKKGTSRVSFSFGSIWVKVRSFKDRISRFELDLPSATAGVHGTEYAASVHRDSSSEIKVFEGEVAVKSRAKREADEKTVSEVDGPVEIDGPIEVSVEEWIKIVTANQMLLIDKDGKAISRNFNKNSNDSWEKWNRERDELIAPLFNHD